MKRLSWMLAAILFCGTLFVSCNKETDTIETTTPSTQITNADLVGTWTGTKSGICTYDNTQKSYTINWTINFQTETAGTINAAVSITGEGNVNNGYTFTSYGIRQNTDNGYIQATMNGNPNPLALIYFEFTINMNNKTFVGDFTTGISDNNDNPITLGGETTFTKQN